MDDVKRGEVLQGQARITTAAAFAVVFAIIAVVAVVAIAKRLNQANQGKPLWQKAIRMPYGFEP
jgi:hypothetical protein